MDIKEYKNYHEKHMTNNTGTSVEECSILLSTIPFTVFLSCYFFCNKSKLLRFSFEYLAVIMPVILNCTLLSHVSYITFLNLVLLCFSVIIMKVDVNNVKYLLSSKLEEKKSFITNYRASTNFVSAICILAVDFEVFPKRLAKTETFGFGFMDLGVGFFICSNGFVEKHKQIKGQFMKLLKTELVLCALGLVRVVTVKSTEYHEHVTEYGVHWNFFFTLALCRLLSHFIIYATKGANPLYLGFITGFVHEVNLFLGLQKWILSNAPRDSFLSANREGVVSCLGYIALYFFASAIGKYLLHSKNLCYKELLIKLFYICILTWIGTAVFIPIVGVSRRLVNLGYIFWILALSLTEIILFLILELCLLSLKREKKTSVTLTVPKVLESINAYGLIFFILSNLLTGLINLMFQTLLLSRIISMILIISYTIILCGAVYVLYLKNLEKNYKLEIRNHRKEEIKDKKILK